MKKGACYNYKIDSRDVDFTGESTYIALMNYLLHAAADDADRNGFGVRDLNSGNCSWVLSRMSAEFARRLKEGNDITVRTWVNDVSRVMTTRNQILAAADDPAPAALSVTQWAVIDIDKRIALDIREHVEYESYLVDEPCPVEKPRRLPNVIPPLKVTHKVVYSDIDFNRHVTALKYLEWMFDLLPIEYITDRRLMRIDIMFLHEARYGNTLGICYEEDGASRFAVTGENGEVHCKTEMIWE